MPLIFKVLGAIFGAGWVLLCYCCCRVASLTNRWEEAHGWRDL